jgi:hypothetical protein
LSKQHLVADVNFIFNECSRLQQLLVDDFRSVPEDEIWADLPAPHGQGSRMLCGRAAFERLGTLASDAARRAGLHRRVRLDTVREPLAELLVQRFVRERRPVTIQQVERVLSAAGRAAEMKCSDVVHLVPCHLMWVEEPDELRIGPVLFRSRRNFRQRILQKVRAYRVSEPGPNGRKWDRTLLIDALHYYRSFKWVAEVAVVGCDATISEELARKAVTSALDCVHLIFGAGHTDRMRVGGPRIRRDERAALQISKDGNLEVSLSSGGMGQVDFPEGWSAALERDDFKRVLHLTGLALEAAVNPDLNRPLSLRFLDAALWFGEAVRETSPAARVVKFVTALERMVMTEEKDDIASLVSERVAALCFDPSSVDSRDVWRTNARTVYDLRSKLVHGVLSPHSSVVHQGVRLGARLGETTLLSALSWFGEDGLRMEKINSKRLGELFDQMVALGGKITGATAG